MGNGKCDHCGYMTNTGGACENHACIKMPFTKTLPATLAPYPPPNVPEGVVTMTRERLRDEFAMAALTGLMARGGTGSGKPGDASFVYEMADAMLKAREGGE